jgi:hypothetical protein
MAKIAKYVPAPYKMNITDPYGDPSEVFTSRLAEALTVVGGTLTQPSSLEMDAGTANILDWGDHGFWLAAPHNQQGVTRNFNDGYYFTFNPTLGHENNFQPFQFANGYINLENIGLSIDLPVSVSVPGWYQGGTVDAWNTVTGEAYYQWFFKLSPTTQYTFSFYVKKLGASEWGGAVNLSVGSGNTSQATSQNLTHEADAFSPVKAPLNTWVRKTISFTTDATGNAIVLIAGYGVWAAGNKTQGMRFYAPQLELGNTASAFSMPRFWSYLALPAVLNVDETLVNGSAARFLGVSIPGSAMSCRLDVRPDFTVGSGYSNRSGRFQGGISPTTAQTISVRPSLSLGTSNRFEYTISDIQVPDLGGMSWGLTGNGSSSSRVKFTLKGVWLRHKPVGGSIHADSTATSGAGHNKYIALRLTDLGSNNFRTKFATMLPGFQPTSAVDAKWLTNVPTNAYDTSQPQSGYATFYAPYLSGAVSFDLLKNADVFLEAIGNVQGFALMAYQGSSYQQFFAVGDFIDSPFPSDDGTIYPKWGIVIQNNTVGYIVASYGPFFTDYWVCGNRGFMTAQNAINYYTSGEPPVPMQEIVLGERLIARQNITPFFVARGQAQSSNRGQLTNFYFSTTGLFTGQVGDDWLGQTGQNFELLNQSTINGAQQNISLYVKP